MPITVYYTEWSAPARAIRFALKQLNLEVNYKLLDREADQNFNPEFVKELFEINPAQTVPTIVDGDVILWESRAILQYLANKYAPKSTLYPSDPKKRAIVDQTLNFDYSYFNSIQDVLIKPRITGTEATEQQVTNYKNNLKLMDTLIGNNKYVAGNDLTIADLSVLSSSTVLILNHFGDAIDLPNLKGWFERTKKELPYYEGITGDLGELFVGEIVRKKIGGGKSLFAIN